MADEGGPGRRYCSVCGYLSSEPVPTCPHCTLSSARVPQVAPVPMFYSPEAYPVSASRGPPAWAVIVAILVIAILTVVIVLAMDGVFSAPSSSTTTVLPFAVAKLLRALA